jgi:hypothetical protein
MNADGSELWLRSMVGRTVDAPPAVQIAAQRARLWARLMAHMPADAAGAWLLFEEQGKGRAEPLAGDTVVGRGEDAQLRPDCRWLSRRHFRLVRDQVWRVEDLGGRNHLFVNEERVAASRPLVSGDLLRIADFHFLFFESA